MTLIVEVPDTYEAERAYVLRHVLGTRLGLPWRLRVVPSSGSVRITDSAGSRNITVREGLFGLNESNRLTEAALPALPLVQGRLPGRRSKLPVLFGDSRSDVIEVRDAEIRINVDLFGGVFFMLTRLEEVINQTRDDHGRFPDEEGVLVKAGLDEVPLADAYVEVLWEALSMAWPTLVRRPTTYSVFLTHDVDRPTAYGERPLQRVRGVGGDLFRRKDALTAVRRLGSLVPTRFRRRLDPYDTFEFLMRVSEEEGLRSAFFFMADRDRRAADHPHLLTDAPIPDVLRRAAVGGHEVGLHGGYASYTNPALLVEELARVQVAAHRAGVTQTRWGGRQHYLRWENPQTWRAWQRAGLSYDSTVGYARRVGFRAGTCHPYETYDVLDRRPLGLVEVPLVVMDVALLRQYTLDGDRIDAVRRLARQCLEYGGMLTILWHNNSLLTTSDGWYQALISDVARVRR